MFSSLGFATKGAAILHLHNRGLGASTIAHDVGSTPRSVRVQLSRAHLKPHPEATSRSGGGPQFLELPPELVTELRPHASRRGLTCAVLAALLLDTIVADDLIDATLDDRGCE